MTRKPIKEVRDGQGRLLGYLPTCRFIEVPYPSFPDWLGMRWPADQLALVTDPTSTRRPERSSILASTAWESFDAYQKATGNTECPRGKAWLGPWEDDRLTFLTGVMSTPIDEVRRSRRRR